MNMFDMIFNSENCSGWVSRHIIDKYACKRNCSLFEDCEKRELHHRDLQGAISDINVVFGLKLNPVAPRETLINHILDISYTSSYNGYMKLRQKTKETIDVVRQLYKLVNIKQQAVNPPSRHLPPSRSFPLNIRLGSVEQMTLDRMYFHGLTVVTSGEMKDIFRKEGRISDPDSSLRTLHSKGILTRTKNSNHKWQYKISFKKLKKYSSGKISGLKSQDRLDQREEIAVPGPDWVLWKDFVREIIHPGREVKPCDFGNLKKKLEKTMGLKFAYIKSRLYLINKEAYQKKKGFFDPLIPMQNPPLFLAKAEKELTASANEPYECYGMDFPKYKDCHCDCPDRVTCEKVTARYLDDSRYVQGQEIITLLGNICNNLMTKPQASRMIQEQIKMNDFLKELIIVWK